MDYRMCKSVQCSSVARRGSQGEGHIVTDPYRPPVGETPTNDIPFIIQISEKLPAEGEDYVYESDCDKRLVQPDKLTCRDRIWRATAW